MTRILWIPHTRWQQGTGHRSKYILRQLKEKHEIHVITWTEPESPAPIDYANPVTSLRALMPSQTLEDKIILHHVPRWTLHRIPSLWRRNQRRLEETVRRIVREYGIEFVVFQSSAYLIGYPPADTGATMVFDYVDYSDNGSLSKYLQRAEYVVCASRTLQEQVENLGHSATHISNGVDLDRLQNADGVRIRRIYGMEGKTVVSLIGLTCAPDFYFADSLARFGQANRDVVFLFVGKGPLYRALRRASRPIRGSSVWTGWVDQSEIYDYFKATDIGLYPGNNEVYFRASCPIKVLEYAAAGKPVVASPIDEVNVLGLHNVIETQPERQAYYLALEQALDVTERVPAVSVPSWRSISERFESFLANPSASG